MWRAIRSATQTHSGCEYLAKAGSSLKLSAKVTDAIATTCTYSAPLLAAHDTGTGIGFLIDKYGVNGEEFSGKTVLEVASVMMNGMQLGGYTRSMFGGSYVTHAAGNYEDAAASNSGKTLKMDLQFFANGESGRNTSIAMECNARANEINGLRGDWESRNGTTAVMKAIDNTTGNEVYLVATNAPNQTVPKSLQGVLNDNEIYIGGKGHAEQTIMNNKGDRYTYI